MVGAGTMGAGIAALAAEASLRTLLYDPDPAALERAPAGVEPVRDLEALAPCGLVIEAAPEDLELKRELFGRLADVVEPDCVLATNTSSLSVTALAAGLPHPARVVGMHFFNPPAKMRLLEVVAGEESDAQALGVAREAGEAMGKHVIEAADTPGFIVNRCNRPFGLEALRVVQDGARHARAGRPHLPHGGRLPDGPVRADGPRRARRRARGLALVLRAVVRRAALAAVAAGGAAGRRRTPGPEGGPGLVRVPAGSDRPTPSRSPRNAGGRVTIAGPLDELRARAQEAGWEVVEGDGRPGVTVDGHELVLSDTVPTGFSLLPPLGRLVEVTGEPGPVERFFVSIGLHVERVDAPVLARIVAQLVNEAFFALGEGVGSAADIDAGMELGLNHPRGPLAWGDLIGLPRVLAILRDLQDQYGDDRWRPAPALLRASD